MYGLGVLMTVESMLKVLGVLLRMDGANALIFEERIIKAVNTVSESVDERCHRC